jgi:hypothetical protein
MTSFNLIRAGGLSQRFAKVTLGGRLCKALVREQLAQTHQRGGAGGRAAARCHPQNAITQAKSDLNLSWKQ